MFNILKRLFSNKKQIQFESDFAASVSELWISDFSKDIQNNRRFLAETGDGYKTYFENNNFSLELLRKELFAWSVNPQYQYKNFCIETTLDFSKIKTLIPESESEEQTSAGYCAFGFLFRYVNDANYYMLLISDKNQFRFDVVFNGNQMPLLGWTEIPEKDAKQLKNKKNNSDFLIPLQIIANGTSFSFIINDQLAATIQDDIIQSEGYLAFAGQNWNEHEKVCCSLPFFIIDSREIQSDAAYQQWNSTDLLSQQRHLLLAESLTAIGRYVPALIELKHIQEKTSKTIILEARINMAIHLYDEAINLLKNEFEKDKTNIEILEEYASALYLSSRYEDFDILFENTQNSFASSAVLCNLKAHVCNLQNNNEKALEWYQNAYKLQETQATHLFNIALTYDKLNQEENAIESALQCASLNLKQNNFTELADCFAFLETKKLSANQKASLCAITGRSYWYKEQYSQAKEKLEEYVGKKKVDKTDDEAFFILAMIYQNENDFESAKLLCSKAIEYNDSNSLYFRVRAEIELDLNQKQEAENDLNQAKTLNENDGWIWYYLAKIKYEENDIAQAKSDIMASATTLPEELAVLNLYGQILNKENRLDAALSLIESAAKHSGHGISYRKDAYHLIANFLKDTSRYDEADVYYKKALDLDSKDELLISDFADLCVKEDKLNEADALIGNSFIDNPTPRISQIIACIAMKKGDYVRSEIALRQGISDCNYSQTNQSNKAIYLSLKIDLGNLYIFTNKIYQAQQIVKELQESEFSQCPEVTTFIEHLQEKTMRKISCANCNRTWFVPKNLEQTGKLNITAQPPDDMPAGICPTCNKVYCIGCAKEKMSDDGRFHCLSCSTNLKLQDPGIIKLLNDWNRSVAQH